MTQTTPTKEQIAEGLRLADEYVSASATTDWSLAGEAARMARTLQALAAQLAEAQDNVTRLEKLVYVPGVWRCAKCGCSTVSAIIDANSGRFAANKEPQRCPNDCGPMWRETERDAGNRLADRLHEEIVAKQQAEAAAASARKLLEECAQRLVYDGDLHHDHGLENRSRSSWAMAERARAFIAKSTPAPVTPSALQPADQTTERERK